MPCCVANTRTHLHYWGQRKAAGRPLRVEVPRMAPGQDGKCRAEQHAKTQSYTVAHVLW